MNDSNDIVNNDERIVTVQEIVDGKAIIFYAIRDVYLDYWRSTEPLNEDKAWTRERRLRAEFTNRSDALNELKNIWRVRRGEPIISPSPRDAEALAA